MVRGLKVTYRGPGGDVPAVRGVDFVIGAGEAVGILGESGAGKTTVSSALLGLLPHSARVEGSVLFDGRELLRSTASDLRSMRGVALSGIFQDPGSSLSPFRRVRDQLADMWRSHHVSSRAQTAARVKETLAQVGLWEDRYGAAYPHELSGGQLQRAAIARAIICRPRLVIADEPLSSVDTPAQSEILGLFRRLQVELQSSFVVISHDPDALGAFVKRWIVINAGKTTQRSI